MKKIILILLILFGLSGCAQTIEYDQPTGEVADMSHYSDLQSEQFYKATFDDVVQFAQDKKTTIIYIGYDTCPWCNSLVPVLNEVSIEKEMKLYYVDFHAEENMDNLDGINSVALLCSDFLEKDEDGELTLYFPTIIYMQQGKVIDLHIATVSGHDATQSALTEKQRARLVYVLEKEFDSIYKK